MFRFPAVVLAMACSLSAAAALAQAPSATRVVPAGIAAGQAIDITFYGARLEGATGLWLSTDAQVELPSEIKDNGTKADRVTFRVTLPEGTAGTVGARVLTPQGASNLRLLLVDDLPTVEESDKAHNSPESAQEIPAPVAIEGSCEAEAFDYYRFTASAGQRLSLEVWARRLGSPLDAVIRVLDASGRELAYSDDDDSSGADSRLTFTAPADGDYLLEIRDIRYQGSRDYRYRVRIGEFPLVVAPFPLAAPSGQTIKLAVDDGAGRAVPPVVVTGSADTVDATVWTTARFADDAPAATVGVGITNGPEQVELEPNDTPETATPITLAGGINGRFDQPRDRDWYQFEASKGQSWVFRGRTRSLGAPTALFLRVLKPDSGLLVEAVDAGADEAVMKVSIPADGAYRLMVEDLHRRGGPGFVYRLGVTPAQPGFTLATDSDKYDAPLGGVVAITVTATRDGYDGPIELSVEGLPGHRLAANTIAEKKPSTVMRLTLPQDLPQGAFQRLRIVGTAKINDQTVTASTRCAAAVSDRLFGLAYPPAELVEGVALGVGPEYPHFFELSAKPETAIWPQGAGSVAVTIQAKRLNKFDDTIALSVENLPAGVEAKLPALEKGKADVQLELTGPVALAASEMTLKVVGQATFENQPKRVELAVPVRVAPALEVSLSAADNGKLKLQLVRHTDKPQPVQLAWLNLPPGVKIAGPSELAADVSEAEFEVTTPASASAVPLTLSVSATTQSGERTIRHTSQPLELRIVSPQVVAQP